MNLQSKLGFLGILAAILLAAYWSSGGEFETPKPEPESGDLASPAEVNQWRYHLKSENPKIREMAENNLRRVGLE